LLPLANKDLATTGACIVVHDLMPVSLVALGIYGGMVASDFALYGIGLGARRAPWLSRYAVGDRVLEFDEALKRNLFGLVALCLRSCSRPAAPRAGTHGRGNGRPAARTQRLIRWTHSACRPIEGGLAELSPRIRSH
jgi:hypothetical protein